MMLYSAVFGKMASCCSAMRFSWWEISNPLQGKLARVATNRAKRFAEIV